MGGRDAMVDILALAPLDKKQEHFLRLLADPMRSGDSLATIVRDAGLLPNQVLSLFREASFTKAHIISMGQLAERVPAIVKDLADKSLDAVIECPDCLGTLEGDHGEACMTCHGRGTVMRPGDLDHKKVALELGGLLKKGPGAVVNVQQNNIATTAPGGYFSRFVKSTDADAYNVKIGAIEGETVG
jgi:hypothetical protein